MRVFNFQLSIFKRQGGASVIEVVLAAAIFTIFASSAVRSLLQNYNANRTGAEYTVATQFASEGLEAVRSIKNKSFSSLVNTEGCGLVRNDDNTWDFQTSCTNNTLVHNNSDNYVRTIKVEDVRRDGTPPSGNIVSTGGTIDPNTKKITSTVTWNFSAGRSESVSLVSYLSGWEKMLLGDGIAIYGNSTGNPLIPRYRLYNNSDNTFGAEQESAPLGSGIGRTFKIETSPIKAEAIAGYVTSTGVLQIMCFDGERWTNEWTQTVGGNGTSQRFGIAYETNSGDALVIYSTNASSNNEMGYRTRPGSSGCGSANWSSHANINPIRTSGTVQWIEMASNPISSSDNIAVIWADSNRDLSAMQWTGSSFGVGEPSSALETDLDWAGTGSTADAPTFGVEVESLSGNVMVVWAPALSGNCTAGNCLRYARYTNAWSSPANIPTVADPTTTFDMSVNPDSNEIVVAGVDGSSYDLSIAYWSGSAWTGRANVDTTAVNNFDSGRKMVATGWLINGSTTRYVVVYHDQNSNNIGWYVGNGNGVPSAQSDFSVSPNFANPQLWYDIQMDPINKDRLMFTVSDNNSDFFAKRLVMSSTGTFTWTNADGGSALSTNLAQGISGPFAFAYWKKQ